MKSYLRRLFAVCSVASAMWLTACGPNVKRIPSHPEPEVFTLGMEFRPVKIKGGPMDGKVVHFCTHETRRRDYEVFFNDPQRDTYLSSYTAVPASARWKQPTHKEVDRATEKQTGKLFLKPTTPDDPVVLVSWAEAMAFCDWYTDYGHAHKSLPADRRCRLPSDHEWSCAVGGLEAEDPLATPKSKDGVIECYPWQHPGDPVWDGKSRLPDGIAGNLNDASAANHSPYIGSLLKGYDDGFPYMAPVKSFRANLHGLYDLEGNATEWMLDNYTDKEDPYQTTWARKGARTRRGGSCMSGALPVRMRSSTRDRELGEKFEPSGTNIVTGFRCVLEQTKSSP